MADEEDLDELKKPKRNKLVILLVVMNLLLIAGAGTWFFLSGGDSAEAQEDSDDSDDEEPEEADPTVFGPLIEMSPIVANLNDSESGRYLKVTMYMEVAADATDEEAAELLRAEVESKVVPIRSRLIVYFSSCTVEDTLGSENKERIAGEIVEVVNEVLGEEKVRRVFYTEFVVQ